MFDTSAPHIDYRLVEEPLSSEIAALESGIEKYNLSFYGESRKTCYFFAYEDGALAGGLSAFSRDKNFYIRHLWVAEEKRRKNIGRELMMRAEEEARARRCRCLWVDTMGYQAPDFYAKCGYAEASRVRGYGGAYDRIFYRKEV